MRNLFFDCVDHGQVGGVDGYGSSHVLLEDGRDVKRGMHRVRFYMYHGYWPEVVMHTCDNPRCVNINHLDAGTWGKNNTDRSRKGRSARAYPGARRLTHDQVRDIRARFTSAREGSARPNPSGAPALSREYGIDSKAIYQIARGHSYSEVI